MLAFDLIFELVCCCIITQHLQTYFYQHPLPINPNIVEVQHPIVFALPLCQISSFKQQPLSNFVLETLYSFFFVKSIVHYHIFYPSHIFLIILDYHTNINCYNRFLHLDLCTSCTQMSSYLKFMLFGILVYLCATQFVHEFYQNEIQIVIIFLRFIVVYQVYLPSNLYLQLIVVLI